MTPVGNGPSQWQPLRPNAIPPPLVLFACSAAAFLLIVVFGPLQIDPIVDITKGSWLIFFAATLFMLGTLLAPAQKRNSADKGAGYTPSVETLFRSTCVLAAVGIGLRLFDRFALRRAPLTLDIDAVRGTLEATQPTILGVIAAPLIGLCYGPLFLYLWMPPDARRRAIAYSLFLFPLVDTLYVASRMHVVIAPLLLLQYFVLAKRLRFSVKTLVGSLFAATAILFGLYAMLQRRGGFAPIESIFASGYARQIQPSPAVVSFLTSFPALSGIVVLAVHLLQYAVHGFFEFSVLVAPRSSDFELTFGATSFPPLASILNSLAPGLQPTSTPLVGQYSTFWGPLYVDFALFMLPVSFLWGAGVGWIRQLALVRPSFIPLMAYTNVIVLAMPFLNLLVGGLGLFMVAGLLLFAIMGKNMRGATGGSEIAVSAD